MLLGMALFSSSTRLAWLICKQNGIFKDEINLEDDDPRIIRLMIDYLYQLDYNELPTSEEITTQKLTPADSLDHNSSPQDDEIIDVASIRSKRDKNGMKRQFMLDQVTPTGSIEGFNVDQVTFFSSPQPSQFKSAMEHRSVPAKLQDLAPSSDADRVVINAHLYALADKYGIEDLKNLAKAKFTKAVEHSWRSEAFVQASRLAFENTPSSDLGLRSVVVNTLHRHLELMDYEEVQELLDSGNGIAWQLVKALLGRP